MTKRYSLCEQVLSGDIFDKYPIGIHDKHISKVLRYPELIDILNEQDETLKEVKELIIHLRGHHIFNKEENRKMCHILRAIK